MGYPLWMCPDGPTRPGPVNPLDRLHGGQFATRAYLREPPAAVPVRSDRTGRARIVAECGGLENRYGW